MEIVTPKVETLCEVIHREDEGGGPVRWSASRGELEVALRKQLGNHNAVIQLGPWLVDWRGADYLGHTAIWSVSRGLLSRIVDAVFASARNVSC